MRLAAPDTATKRALYSAMLAHAQAMGNPTAMKSLDEVFGTTSDSSTGTGVSPQLSQSTGGKHSSKTDEKSGQQQQQQQQQPGDEQFVRNFSEVRAYPVQYAL